MGKRRELLIRLLLIVVVIGCLTQISWGQENDIVNLSPPSPAKSVFSQEDILNHAQKSLDGSISILNTVATLMAVLVALLTLIVVIGGAFGLLELNQWRKLRKNTESDLEKAKPTIDRLKKAEEEIDTFRERAKHLPSLSEPFSEDQKKILDEYGKKIDSLEAIGVPLKSEDYFSYGDYHYRRGEYELALKAFDKAIELKPGFAEAWNNRGVALGKLDRRDEALKAFDKATKLKPGFAEAWYNLAFTYNLKGDKENALKNLSEAISLDDEYKKHAKRDEDFKNLWDDEYFKRIVS